FINITILIFGIVTIELCFGAWLKNSNYSNLLIPRQQTNIINSFPYEQDSLGIYSRDKNGFRANQYNLNQINILILGGSTTEERDVDDNKIWTKIFEKNLNKEYKVLNAGIGGQTSYGHRSMFNMWFSKYIDLNPDFIIVYLGINDALYFVESLSNKNILHKGRQLNSSNRDTLISINFYDRFVQYLKNNSIFHSVYLIVKGNIISNKYKVSYNSEPSIFKAYYQEAPLNMNNHDQDITNIFIDYYNENLREIAEYSKNYNAKLIFVTQVISNNHWLSNYLHKINFLTINYCKLNKITCINLEDTNIKLKQNHFYDGIHTTPDGSKIVGEFIAGKFNNFD
ncbi:SGNH/GDSL hydrolase family protein, partial [Pelagibacteraceae bacterium]|nr:SGNH/GDSL hydrolase family protein [Pelagibacteraceae bacterium]